MKRVGRFEIELRANLCGAINYITSEWDNFYDGIGEVIVEVLQQRHIAIVHWFHATFQPRQFASDGNDSLRRQLAADGGGKRLALFDQIDNGSCVQVITHRQSFQLSRSACM